MIPKESGTEVEKDSRGKMCKSPGLKNTRVNMCTVQSQHCKLVLAPEYREQRRMEGELGKRLKWVLVELSLKAMRSH